MPGPKLSTATAVGGKLIKKMDATFDEMVAELAQSPRSPKGCEMVVHVKLVPQAGSSVVFVKWTVQAKLPEVPEEMGVAYLWEGQATVDAPPEPQVKVPLETPDNVRVLRPAEGE